MTKHAIRLNIEALDEAVRAVANKDGKRPTRLLLVDKLPISRGTLYYWINHGITPKGLLQIEEVSGVPRERLAPEFFRNDEAA